MDIAERDILLEKMAEQIKKKEAFLQERFRELKTSKDNKKILQKVHDDYLNYFNYISSIKQNQLNAFEKISTYLDKVGCEMKTTESLLEETKNDQREVMGEIEKLRNELNLMITPNDTTTNN